MINTTCSKLTLSIHDALIHLLNLCFWIMIHGVGVVFGQIIWYIWLVSEWQSYQKYMAIRIFQEWHLYSQYCTNLTNLDIVTSEAEIWIHFMTSSFSPCLLIQQSSFTTLFLFANKKQINFPQFCRLYWMTVWC